MEQDRTILIFSGYNERAVFAFLRTLSQNRIENYSIIALSKQDSILRSIYRHKVGVIRDSKALSIEIVEDILIKVRKREQEQFIIMPGSEYLNRFLIREQKKLLSLNCVVPLVDRGLYERVSDKETFRELCKQYGIEGPELISFPIIFKEPFVAKPKKYFAQDGKIYSPILICGDKDYEMFQQQYNKTDFYYERFVRGRSYYLLYYYGKKGDIYRFSQENLVQQPHGKSIVAAKSSNIHRDEISAVFEKMLLENVFWGLIMVEIRISKSKIYMIEANPRMWGPSQLFVDAGCNFFEVLLSDYGLLDKKIIWQEKESRYFWNGGIVETWKNGGQLSFFGNGEEELFEEYSEWIKADIYRRNDTRELFLSGE